MKESAKNKEMAFIGGFIEFFIIGPCALESLHQVKPVVALAKKWGIPYFRAQIFKPRTNPDSFQGIGEDEGLPLIHYIKEQGLKVVCEVCSFSQLDTVEQVADIVQIGARNMQNFELLKEVGKRPAYKKREPYVLLKRGFANTMFEWVSAAKYLEMGGVPPEKIILCERGTRNFCSPTEVTLDFAMAYKVRRETNYKVIIDPSHGTRDSALVFPMVRAAHALDFDGVIIEVHPHPAESVSDPFQTLSVEELDAMLSTYGDKLLDGNMRS